ncbi:MAG: hypothetical protein JWO72_161 [Caulobacteraceae bacterium]|jgi:hypothetical protein|nr:hypothetical protein [Caulobacteraceae bacterium]
MDMVVVCAPASAAEMDACVSALRTAGFHPMAAYQGARTGIIADTPSTYPVLVPKNEVKAALALLQALKGGAPAQDQYEPPVATAEQLKRSLGLVLVMALVIAGVTALLLFAQFLGGLLGHHG